MGLRAKQFMTFSVSVKHKKDKNLFLHIDLTTYSYKGNKTRIDTFSVLTHAASTGRDWNKYLHFQQSSCLSFTIMACTNELHFTKRRYGKVQNDWEYFVALTNSIIYTCPARNHSIAVWENDISMKIMHFYVKKVKVKKTKDEKYIFCKQSVIMN